MLSFREQMEKDIDGVLFNEAEAAQDMTVNGTAMPVIEDNQKLEELKAKSQYADAICTAERLIYVRSKDFGAKPANGSVVTVDGETYRISTCTDYGGGLWYQIVLEANG